MQRRHFVISLASAAAAAAAVEAQAQPGFPAAPVKLVVPFAAGGPTDAIVRVIANPMGEVLRQPMLVDYKPGAGSRIATEFVANAPPDGYTLLVNGLTGSLLPLLTKLPFDPDKALIPVTQICTVPYVLVVRKDLPAANVKEFISYLKANPGKLNYGSSAGTGSSTHFLFELFQDMTASNSTMVPYKGSIQAITDILSGRLDFMFDNYSTVAPFIKDGRVRPLAVTTTRRSGLLPELPTLIEAGLPNFDVATWIGLLAPAGTPQATVDVLHKAATEVLRRPAVQTSLMEMGTDPTLNAGGPQLAARRRADTAIFGPLIERMGLTHKF